MRNEPELNALIGSRICHDLISPIGAIGNGVELLTMSGVRAAPEISLISESVENANARIRFFRIAFGAAGNDALIGNMEIRNVLNDFFRSNRINVDWRINQGWDNTPADIPEFWQLGEFDTKFRLKHAIASRLGLKYYLWPTKEFRPNNLYFSFHINANLGQADFTEFGIGYIHQFDLIKGDRD